MLTQKARITMENQNNNKVMVGELRSSPQIIAWFEEAMRQPGGLWCPGLPLTEPVQSPPEFASKKRT